MSPTIYVLNNEWGDNGYGGGSITVKSATSWATSWDFAAPTDWTVLSYPAAVLGWQWGYRAANTGLPVQLASRTPINATVAFDVVPDASCAPGGVGGGGAGSRRCRIDVAYDLWLHTSANAGTSTPAYEIMIWLAYSRELFAGTPALARVTLGGHRWKVIQTQGGSSPVATFLLDEPADLTGATLNLTDFTDWLVENDWIPGSWWLDSVQFGVEVFSGKGTLNVTHYTATVGGGPPSGPPSGPATGPASGPVSGPASGSPRPPDTPELLGLRLNQTSFRPGETMVLDAHLRPLAPSRPVDVYLVVRMPDGRLASLLADGRVVPGIVPVVARFDPSAPVGGALHFTFTGAEAPGTYAWIGIVAEAGSGTIIGVEERTFTVGP